jgi:hypothetical protein
VQASKVANRRKQIRITAQPSKKAVPHKNSRTNKTPNPKSQVPEKIQTPLSQSVREREPELNLDASLEFGAWNFSRPFFPVAS